MIYSINYMDMAKKISPLAIARYLKETGWRQFIIQRQDIKVFQYDKDQDCFQVNIPMDNSLSDYGMAMYSAIETVAHVEEKSIEQVMLFLLNPNTDIIKIRLDKKDMEVGNILFDDAIRLYDNAKKLLASTAADIINPKMFHYGRQEDAVQKFLADCRYGQTEIGSYVVSIVCPFAELTDEEGYKQLSFFSDDERCANSLTRNVTNKLLENVHIIKESIDNDDIKKFTDTTQISSISANFFEALGGMNLYADDTVLEIKAEWSPVVKSNRYEFSEVRISNAYYEPIKAIVDTLKEKEGKSTEIVGRIKQLDAFPVADKRKSGSVKISYIDEQGKSKVASTVLNKYDYDNAIEAHQLGKYVKIVGNIKEGKKAKIECLSFSVIE